MTRILRHGFQWLVLVLGVVATSAAFAVSTTLDVTPEGKQANETTINLYDSNKNLVPPVAGNPNRYVDLAPGRYTVDVYVRQADGARKLVRSGDGIDVKEGANGLRVPESGPAYMSSVLASGPATGFLSGVRFGGFNPYAGGGTMNGLGISLGVNQADDSAALNSKPRINTTTYGFELPFVKDGQYFDRARFEYTFGSGTSSTQTAPDAKAGWTYFMPSPTGSTGLAFLGGMNALLQTKVEQLRFEKTLPGQLLKENKPWSLWGDPVFGYQYTKTTYNGVLNSIMLPTISSTTNQQIKQNDFLLGYGLRGEYKPNPDTGWISGVAGLYADYYWARYNGSQWNMCPACTGPAQMLTFSNNDNKNQLTFGAFAGVAAGYPISKNFGIYGFGQYRYVQDTATLQNQVAPSSSPTHLGNGSRNWATLGLGLQFSF